MAFLSNTVVQVQNSLSNVKTIYGRVSINSFPPANATGKLQITNPDTGEISYTLLGLFSNFFIENALIASAGKTTPNISLIVTLQLPEEAGSEETLFDVSDQVVGDISVNWPEDSSGSASVSLSVMRDLESFSTIRNPFETLPTSEGTSPIQIGARIIIKTAIAFGSPSEATFTHRIFTGRVASMSFDSAAHAMQLSCVDMSYDVSLASSRVSRDFFAIQDKQFEEKVVGNLIAEDGSSNIIIDEDGLGDHRFVELSLSFARATADLKMFALAGNGLVASDVDFGDVLLNDTAALISETPPEETETRKNIIRIDVTRTEGLFEQFLQRAVPSTVFRVTYEVSEKDALELVEDAPRKSEVVRTVLEETAVQDYEIQHANAVEDEATLGNIIANREFPLDFVRKIIVPQTWHARYNTYGTLLIGRERLIDRPDLAFTDLTILDGSLTIKKDISDVVNTQEVAGALISTPAGSSPPTLDTSPPPIAPRNARWVKVGSKTINVATEEVVPRYGIDPATLVPGFFTLHCIITCNLRAVSADGVVDGPLAFGNKYGQFGAYQPKLNIKTTTFGETATVGPSNSARALIDTGRAPGFGPVTDRPMSIYTGWMAYALSNNDFNFASYGTNWGYVRQDMFNRTVNFPTAATDIDEVKWFGSVTPVIFPSAFAPSAPILPSGFSDLRNISNKPVDGLFTNLTTPSRVVEAEETFYASVTIMRAFSVDRDTGITTLNGFTGEVEAWVRVRNPGSPTHESAIASG